MVQTRKQEEMAIRYIAMRPVKLNVSMKDFCFTFLTVMVWLLEIV